MKPSPGLSSGVSRDRISLDCCGDWATLRSRQPRKYVTEYMKRPTKAKSDPWVRQRPLGITQSDQGIHAAGAARREITSNKRHEEKNQRCGSEAEGITGVDSVEKTG